MMRRLVIAVIGGGVAAALLSGCGGGESGRTPPGAPGATAVVTVAPSAVAEHAQQLVCEGYPNLAYPQRKPEKKVPTSAGCQTPRATN